MFLIYVDELEMLYQKDATFPVCLPHASNVGLCGWASTIFPLRGNANWSCFYRH